MGSFLKLVTLWLLILAIISSVTSKLLLLISSYEIWFVNITKYLTILFCSADMRNSMENNFLFLMLITLYFTLRITR